MNFRQRYSDFLSKYRTSFFFWIYGFSLLIAGIECVVLTPPFQVADEFNHFMRAVQVSQGTGVGIRRDPTTAGGVLPSSLITMGQSFDYLKFNPDKKVDLGGLSQAYMTPWSQNNQFIAYPNTVFYPPSSYAGVVLGIWGGHALGTRPLATLYFGRAVNGIICFAIVLAALALAEPLAPFLAAVLALPMSVSLMASTSQDGLLLALSALASSLIGQCLKKKDEKFTRILILGLGIILACIAAAKVPYAPVLFLPLCLTIRKGVSAMWPIISCCLGWLLFMAWVMLGIRPSITTLAPPGASSHDQVMFVLHHPLQMVTIFLGFVTNTYKPMLHEAIGVLGWLDTFLPPVFYHVAEICLLVIFFAMFCSIVQKPQKQAVIVAGCVALLLAASGTGVILALYVSWTAVGAPHIDGVQGRYFLPLVLLLPIIVQLLASNTQDIAATEKAENRRRFAFLGAQTLACVFMVFSALTLYSSLTLRFWP